MRARPGSGRLADAMPQIVWVTRPDGYHEYYNRRWYEYIGCTPEECIGHGWNAPLHPDDRRRSIDRWDLALRTGEPYEIEYRFRSRDGEYRWFLGRALPVRDDAGRIVKWFGTCTDIEDMKRAEEEARLSHARFEAVLDAAPIGVYVVDADLRIRQVNPKARPVFGDIDGLIGGDFVEVIHVLWPPAYAAEVVERFRHTLATGEPCFIPERIEERLDRRVLEYYDWQVHRIPLPGGQYGVVCYFSDISRHVLARQALAEADRRKDEFLATLAHELRNPLAPIRTGLEILKYREGDNAAVEPLRAMMERQAGHLARLVDDLMDVSRISHGADRAPQGGRATWPRSWTRRSPTARPFIDERGHELSVGVPDGDERLEADPTRLEQILANLLENAAKYTDPGGRIRLEARREGGEVVFSVQDTGIGIDPEKLTTIFDMFVQVERRLDRSQGGLGIGLSLVKSLVEMHGGRVDGPQRGAGQGQRVRRPPAGDRRRARGSGRAVPPAPDGDGLRATPAAHPRRGRQPGRRGQPGPVPGQGDGAAGRGRLRRPGGAGGGGGVPPGRDPAGHRAAGDGRQRGGPAAAGAARVREDVDRGADGLGPGGRRGAVQGGGLRSPSGQAGEPGGHPRTAEPRRDDRGGMTVYAPPRSERKSRRRPG